MSNFCDRCLDPDVPAVRSVACYQGCIHRQCAAHAEATVRERREEMAYDAEVREAWALSDDKD